MNQFWCILMQITDDAINHIYVQVILNINIYFKFLERKIFYK